MPFLLAEIDGCVGLLYMEKTREAQKRGVLGGRKGEGELVLVFVFFISCKAFGSTKPRSKYCAVAVRVSR
jgi:hypothetical protein